MFKRTLTFTVTAAAMTLLAACGSSTPSAPSADSTTTPTAQPAGPVAVPTRAQCAYAQAGAAAKAAKAPGSTPNVAAGTVVTLVTNRGTVAVTVDPQHTPCTVNSFVSLAKQGYFDKTPCHRLTTSGIYVLQCGDPSGTGTGGPGYTFNDELPKNDARVHCDAAGNCIYPAGTVAMANAGPDTNGSQFFLVYKDSPLPYNYAVFGTMSAAGLKVVQQIAAAGSDNSNGAGDGHPQHAVTIQTATVAP